MLGWHVIYPFSDNPFRCVHCGHAPDPDKTLVLRRAILADLRSKGLLGLEPAKNEHRWGSEVR